MISVYVMQILSYNQQANRMINFRSDKKNFYDTAKNSRYELVSSTSIQEDQSKFDIPRNQSAQTLNVRLQSNFTQIMDLLKERKHLINKKAQLMKRDNDAKVLSIATARMQDLKNEARTLKDQSLLALVQNADRMIGTKSLLSKIVHYDASVENIEKNKGKRYWDKYKEIDGDLQGKNKKYLAIIAQLEKFTQKERVVFQQIERYEADMVFTLTRKERDYMKKAQLCNEQIQKRKNTLKSNKAFKDKKKIQLVEILASILDTVKFHQDSTVNRQKQVEELFAGSDGVEVFDSFLQNLEVVVQGKVQDNKIDSFRNLSQLMNQFQGLMEHVMHTKDMEQKVFQEIYEGMRKNIKFAILEKSYLSGLPSSNRTDLQQLVQKCKLYRKLLANLQEDRQRINKQLSKINQLNTFFYAQYKANSNQANRKRQLVFELERILNQQNALQKNQKQKRDFQYKMSTLELRKRTIQRQLQQCANKANFAEYRSRVKQLQMIEKEIEEKKNIGMNQNSNQLQTKLLTDIQILNEKYPDLIREVIIEENQMSYINFLNKLSKRLSLI